MSPLRAKVVTACAVLCAAGCSGRDSDDHAPVGSAGAAGAGLPYHELAAAAPPPSSETLFSERGRAFAEVVRDDRGLRVLHDGRPGKAYAAVQELALSRDGRRCAYGALVDGKWRMVVDGRAGAPFDAVAAPRFSPDGAHLAYLARAGDLWHLVVDATVGAGTRTGYQGHEFSADGSRIAFVEGSAGGGPGKLVVSDLALRERTVVDPAVTLVASDPTQTRLAAVAAAGTQRRLLTARFDSPGQPSRGPAFDGVSNVAFSPDGGSVAYVGERSGRRVVVLDQQEAPVVAGHVASPPVIVPGRKAVGVLLVSLSNSVLVQEYFGAEKPRDASYEEAEGLAYSRDGRQRAYAARRGASWFIVLNGKEGPPFDRVVSPVFSPDGGLVAYRARKGGRRFVVVASTDGTSVRMHDAHDEVFPVRFESDGRSIGYGIKDGPRTAWMTEAP